MSINTDGDNYETCKVDINTTITDKGNIINVSSGEICTIEMAKKYGIFDKTNYFNNSITETNNINKYIDNIDTSLDYSLCFIKDTKAFENCSLTTKNPWKSLTTDNKCSLPLNIKLPEPLKYNENETFKIDKPGEVVRYKNMKDHCQNKWYDWFVVPDYHLGNATSLLTNTSNVCNCYKPCDIGFIPVVDKTDNTSYCTFKDKYNYGYYKGTFNYTPLALVLLLGSTEDVLMKIYSNNLINIKKVATDVDIDFDLYNDIQLNNNTQHLIYNSIKIDMRTAITELFKLPFDHENIIVPIRAIKEASSFYLTKENLEVAYDIALKYSNFIKASTPEELTAFKEWKNKLIDINGFTADSFQINKLLLILKKACNILFDNTTSYSTDEILYVLNKNSTEPKKPITFNISDKDILLSVSSNIAENGQTTVKLTDNIEVKKVQEQETVKLQPEKDPNQIPLKANNYNELSLKLQQDINPILITDKLTKTLQSALLIFQIFCLLLLFSIFIAVILHLLWKPITYTINIIYMSLYYFMFYIQDLFTGNTDAPSLYKNIAKLNLTQIESKIKNEKY